MKNICFLSDFDGTITEIDGLGGFFEKYASAGWLEIEKLWEENKISSKECLQKEFEFVPDLSAELICNYLKTVNIDPYFKEFYDMTRKIGADFYIVSGGADYFITKMLENYNIKGMNIFSNHFEFTKDGFSLTFPNDSAECSNNAGTCKCSIIKKMKEKYKQVIYIGDGISDYCAADKADKLFAKRQLIEYCRRNNINCIEFKNFKDIIECFSAIQ